MKSLLSLLFLFMVLIHTNAQLEQTDIDTSGCSVPRLVFVDEQARFQGGNLENFREWFQKNLTYPIGSEEYGISSRVTLQFIVTVEGKVDCIRVLRPNGSLFEKEAVRVLMLCPDWTPAKHQGKLVNQQFVMPILRQLQ